MQCSGGWAAPSSSGRAGTGSPTSATRSRSTTRCARRSASGTSRRFASGTSRARTPWPRSTTASPRTWRPSRSARRATAPSATRTARCSATALSTVAMTRPTCFVVTALDTDVLHFRRVTSQFDVEITEHTFEIPHLQVQGPRSRELLSGLTDEDVAGLKYFRFIPQPVTVAGVEGCYVVAHRLQRRARLRGVLPDRGRRPAVAGPARPRRVASASAPTAWRPSSRCGSRPG